MRRLWSRRGGESPADLSVADEGMVGTLDALDSAVNYRDWILGLSGPHLQDAGLILEVGAGHGTFTGELARFGDVTAIELGDNALKRLTERFAGRDEVRIMDVGLERLDPDAFDAAFLSNVLEHIEDDVEALRQLARAVRRDGRIIVFSPAFRLLYSRFDARIGHHHRYRLPELRRRFEEAGIDVVESRYVNTVGFFSWFLLVRLLGLTPERSGLVHVFDRCVVPVLRWIERRWSPPFGQSVFVVGRVRD